MRRCGSRALIVGLTAGAVLFLLLLTIGSLCFENVSLEAGGIGLLCGCLCGGAAAGLLGSGKKKSRTPEKTQKIMKSGDGCGILILNYRHGRETRMKHVKTLNGATLKKSAAHGGCGECQTSCQSACKTSCTSPIRSARTSKNEQGLKRVGTPTLFPCRNQVRNEQIWYIPFNASA